MGRIIVNRGMVWATLVAVMATFTAVSAQAQQDEADDTTAAPTEANDQAAANEGAAAGEAGDEFALTPTVVEAVSQRDAYGLDGFYQPGRSSFALGGTLAEPEKVPFTFSVVDEDLLTDINPEELDSIAQFVPGVQPGNQVTNVSEVFVSRGFQLGRDNILINGMQRADVFSVTPKELVSEIEFYRGPSSILNGQTPPGGAANIVTKKPLAESFARLTGTGGQYETFGGAADLNIADMNLFGVEGAFRLNVAARSSDTFRDALDRESILIAPVLTLNLTDRTAATFEVNYSKLTTPDDRGLPLPSYINGARPVTDEEAERFDESAFILGTTAEENEQEQFRLMFDASHQWTDRIATNFQISYDNTERSFFSIFPDAGTFDPATGDLDRDHFGVVDEFESVDVRLDTTFEFQTGPVVHRGIVGFQYRHFENVETGRVFAGGFDTINVFDPDHDLPFAPMGAGRGREAEEESFEGFFQDAIEVVEGPLRGVSVVGGGRVINYETFGVFSGNQDGTEFVPRVGIGYTPPAIEWLTVYGSYSESLDPQSVTNAAGEALPPEEGEQWEAGFKAVLLDERLTVNFAWFDLENTNVGVTDPGDPANDIAIGKQQNQGVELEVIGELTPNLQVYGQYTYNDTEIVEDIDRQGNKLPLAPSHSGSLWLRYDLPMFASPLVSNARDQLTLAGGVVFVGDRFATVDNVIELTSYARFDLMARYVLAEKTSVQLTVQNVTDERYFTGGNTFGGSVTPGQPLTVIASITHEF